MESDECLSNFDNTKHDFALRYIWIVGISSFDLFLTELVSEAGLRLIDKNPDALPVNLQQVQVPMVNVLDIHLLSPPERLLFFRERIFASIQFKSFYRPEKVSEALSYIWSCPPKEKWSRITARMRATGHHGEKTEQDIRDELTLIGDRRDLIAHSADTPPGRDFANPVSREDAARVAEFVCDLAEAIDAETEAQLD
ncbi:MULTISPECIES: hypothetical protein [Sphingobium]|uniref:RiboL-PSP-HEPN domain-containing protein n=1 Tax=Sphingobium indicum (strain DSM 16413 / CCM 7287 / MTCC 6362 / UT26 / NBRC 101211 / UT26S) TaxID=452662 RepID=D4Z5S4_SPHIU|nr:hypothetical protein [Sphingobium indicum]BAI97956.1 hypothetical protein SJA_C1-31220 [Sphingobium indicum UT26S]